MIVLKVEGAPALNAAALIPFPYKLLYLFRDGRTLLHYGRRRGRRKNRVGMLKLALLLALT